MYCRYFFVLFVLFCFFFFVKQRTAYEMRISDWSSDVCSSDLAQLALRRGPRWSLHRARGHPHGPDSRTALAAFGQLGLVRHLAGLGPVFPAQRPHGTDRKSVV